MDDYISRQDAIKVLTRKEREEFNDWERSGDERSLCAKKAYSSSIFVIYDLPSADVVEVVRCKYCKHSTEWYRDKRRCFLWCEDGIDVFEDGYCSYGRK